eukprot:CAMPEP_0177162330 /NCGR_PEP_ID=MMETSP0367-20130122/5828_1 /TAXON_ID=447022 ORGANISM="Scrippsiella hangoei-like, Strain SHHI-4" /NCGR_SAMPLE_ID=MMETSP0367 /ASSEMBLY_ACC=CAM_ASM_000362 /LENGTH=174 /DNA_ID=CAMNT_0018608095 /DNA_START=428 /DNA_END=953 /DNA_ORIENTATION=-
MPLVDREQLGSLKVLDLAGDPRRLGAGLQLLPQHLQAPRHIASAARLSGGCDVHFLPSVQQHVCNIDELPSDDHCRCIFAQAPVEFGTQLCSQNSQCLQFRLCAIEPLDSDRVGLGHRGVLSFCENGDLVRLSFGDGDALKGTLSASQPGCATASTEKASIAQSKVAEYTNVLG